MDGSVWLGPAVVLGFSRDRHKSYSWTDVKEILTYKLGYSDALTSTSIVFVFLFVFCVCFCFCFFNAEDFESLPSGIGGMVLLSSTILWL